VSLRRPALAAALAVALSGAVAGPVHAHKAHCLEPSPIDATGSRLGLTHIASVPGATFVAAAPGDPSRVYVVDRLGAVRVIRDGVLLERPFLDLRPEIAPTVDDTENERGLQSIVFAPDYVRSGRMYAFYSDGDGDSRLTEFRRSADPDVAKPAGRDVMRVEHSFSGQHYGGGVAFGADGALYVALGDAVRFGWSQSSRKRFYGKVVRSTLRRGSRWTPVAAGLRNPFRMVFDRSTGRLLIGDVGEDTYEEINVVSRRDRRTGTIPNFGWPAFEGAAPRASWPMRRHALPAVALPHPDAHSIVAGPLLRSNALGPALRGRQLLGDFCDGTISSVRLSRRTGNVPRAEEITVPFLSSLAADEAGRVYATSLLGEVYRVDPAA
jgi:glucose/arabinose dehydrogenase